MGQPSLPPPPVAPPPPPSLPPQPAAAGCRVRCAGCKDVLTVPPGMTEFVCPNCKLPQMLPPDLMRAAQSGQAQQQRSTPAHGIDPTKIQLPCASCKAVLNVPYGLSRFNCPQCGVSLSVDVSKTGQSFPPVDMSKMGSNFNQVRPPMPVEEVNEVAIDVEREEDEGGLAGETFLDYRPSKLSIGAPHPDPIVETSSLSAIQPPEPTYKLRIQADLESSNALSCLQIETLVYACQRHLHHLPDGTRAGFFLGDGAGVGKGRTIAGLIWENWHHGRRKTLWISVGSDLKYDAERDLSDVGATCIKVHALNKQSYSKLDSRNVGIKEGVIFLTYNSLIASSEKGRSRLKQLVEWCGQFDGLVVFDECHKAKNLFPETGSQPTRTGEAVVDIQAKLPQARIIYCSATGASEPRNLGYMVRLGLWGAGTSFTEFRDFLGAMEKGGVGALELVAMDMKARGMYVCRTLSYKGAEFDVVEAPLETEMMDMYDKAARFWAQLRVELLTAYAYNAAGEKPNSSQIWRLYWASHQRFFRHMCMSAKVPAVVRLSKKALIEDKCVVIGLQSTGEARTEEALTKYGSELEDFISGPRELLLKFVEDNYPLPDKPELPEEGVLELPRKRHSAGPDGSFTGRVRKVAKQNEESEEESDWESQTDTEPEAESDDEFQICNICNSDGERKKLLQCSTCNNLFHPACLVPPVVEVILGDWSCPSCKEKTEEYLRQRQIYHEAMMERYEVALKRKLKIVELIRSLNLPNNPLDDIMDQLGGPDKVAEITGRRGMLVRASGGKGVTYQARNTKEVTMEMVNMHEKQQFMDGKKLVAIISEAGSAGVSLQADRRVANQKRRVHLTLELPWSADRAIQQFGRTHRSNQSSAPEYRLLFTNLGGERRFASIVAKRLESLGALTQGDRRAGPSLSAYNYDSVYGKKALALLYKGLMGQERFPVTPPGCSYENPDTIQDFILKGNVALVSVGIMKDPVVDDEDPLRKISGRVVDSDMNDVGRFLNRILGLPPDIQNKLFELFVSILDLITQSARAEGHLDSGIVDLKANTIELQEAPKTVHIDDMSGAPTMLFTFTLDRGMAWEVASTLLEDKQNDDSELRNNGFYESKREWMGKRHFMLAFEDSASGMYKVYRPTIGESIREMPLSELKSKYRKVSALERAQHGWEDEYEVSSKECMHGPNCKLGSFCTVGRRLQEVNVLGGLILPVWGAVAKALSKQARQSHRRIRVVRIETTSDSKRVVGLLIPNAAVEIVLQDLAWVQNIDD